MTNYVMNRLEVHGAKEDIDEFLDICCSPKRWLDTRNLPRQLSADELDTIKNTITEFLTKEFRRCRVAIAPYAETVAKYY